MQAEYYQYKDRKKFIPTKNNLKIKWIKLSGQHGLTNNTQLYAAYKKDTPLIKVHINA